MIHKTVRLEENDVEYIEKVMAERKIGNFADALRFIIADHKKSENELRAIFRSIEKNQDVLLDVANTFLIHYNLEFCQPVQLRESPVIKKSKEYRKVRMDHLKQKKDWKNRREN